MMSLLDQVIAWSDGNLVGGNVSQVLGVASHEVLYTLAGLLPVIRQSARHHC